MKNTPVYSCKQRCKQVVNKWFTMCLQLGLQRCKVAGFTTCLQRVYNVFTAWLTTCLQCVYNLFTICLQLVYNVFTMCLQP